MLKPSAAPSVNQSSIRIGDLLRRAGEGEMAAGAGEVRQQLPQGRLFPPHQAQDHLGAAARRLDRRGRREILRR